MKDDLQPRSISLFLADPGTHPGLWPPGHLQNTVALGGLFWLLHLDFDMLEAVLREIFGGRRSKDESVVEANVGVAGRLSVCPRTFPRLRLPLAVTGKQRLVTSGNELFGLGALAVAVFYAAYPMAPSTPCCTGWPRTPPAMIWWSSSVRTRLPSSTWWWARLTSGCGPCVPPLAGALP